MRMGIRHYTAWRMNRVLKVARADQGTGRERGRGLASAKAMDRRVRQTSRLTKAYGPCCINVLLPRMYPVARDSAAA